MVAEKGNKKLSPSILEDKSEITVTAVFERFGSQLADREAAVHVGLTKAVNQIAKSKEALYPFVLWELAEATDDRWIDGKKLTQASS